MIHKLNINSCVTKVLLVQMKREYSREIFRLKSTNKGCRRAKQKQKLNKFDGQI